MMKRWSTSIPDVVRPAGGLVQLGLSSSPTKAVSPAAEERKTRKAKNILKEKRPCCKEKNFFDGLFKNEICFWKACC